MLSGFRDARRGSYQSPFQSVLQKPFNCLQRRTFYEFRAVDVRRCEQHRTTAVRNKRVIRLSVCFEPNLKPRRPFLTRLKKNHTQDVIQSRSIQNDDLTRPRGCKTFSCSTQPSMKVQLLINDKIAQIA